MEEWLCCTDESPTLLTCGPRGGGGWKTQPMKSTRSIIGEQSAQTWLILNNTKSTQLTKLRYNVCISMVFMFDLS